MATFTNIANTLPAAATFNPAAPGRYVISSWTFGSPMDFYQLTPARPVKGSKFGRKSLTTARTTEVDVTVAGVTTRRSITTTVNIQIDDGIAPAVADTHMVQMNEFITLGTLNTLLAGGS